VIVKKKVKHLFSLEKKGITHLAVCAFALFQLSGMGVFNLARAQTTPANKKPQVHKRVGSSSNKQMGLKDLSNRAPAMSMSLNPELFQRKSASALTADIDGNLDYRVQHGCLHRSFNEDNLPASIGIVDKAFSEFFKEQTKTFFSHMRGNCIPYAAALGTRNRFDSLSIMNGPIQDSKTEVWTFTPLAVGGYLIQQDYLKEEAKRYSEIDIPLRDVLYDPRKVGDKLPVELVWELNSLIKQIYPEDMNSLENTNSVVRLIVDFGDREHWAQIWAAEIIDPSNGEVFSSAFWLERGDIPGGFYTGSGEAIERSFWTNPLSYRRISRGVGQVPVTGSRKSSKSTATASTKTKMGNPPGQRYRAHMGIDYAAPIGTPVFSVANGKVVHLGYSGAYGNLIVLEHVGGYHTYYAHLSSFNPELEMGNEVRRGLEIGAVGSTGRSTGPHLHFELRKDGVYVDPYSPRMQLDLWSMRDGDSSGLTREILLLGTPIKN
jgi:murein DD-endopeptidase MepM/ murein hydrolase activator NlpD